MKKLLGLLAFGLAVVTLVACAGEEQQESGVQVGRIVSVAQPTWTAIAQPEVTATPTVLDQTAEVAGQVTPLCAISGSYDPDGHWQIICSVVRGKEYFVVVIYDVETKTDALAARTAFETMAKRAYGVDLCRLILHYVYPNPILGEMAPEELFPTGCVG